MLNVKIQKCQKSVIEANGAAVEIVADIATLVNAIHTQFSYADPDVAKEFRAVFTAIVNDPEGKMWIPIDGQTGVIFPKI